MKFDREGLAVLFNWLQVNPCQASLDVLFIDYDG